MLILAEVEMVLGKWLIVVGLVRWINLVPLEVSDNIEEENNFQSKNGSAQEDGRRPRIAAQNADLIRNLQIISGDPDGHVGGVCTLAFNAVLYRDWLKTRVLCYDLIFWKRDVFQQ